MSVIAEFTLDQEDFSLGSVVAPAPEMTIELDRIVPVTKPGVPYVWASGGDFDEFERIVGRSSLIETLTMVDRTGESTLYRIKWGPDAKSLLQELARANVTVLEAYREDRQWFFRLRFDDHDDLVRFHDYCSEHDIDYELARVYPDVERQRGCTAFGLTQEQYDTLVLAIERGYFRVPRGVTLQELGREIGITQQAVSERLRRAADIVLRTVLLGPVSEPAV